MWLLTNNFYVIFKHWVLIHNLIWKNFGREIPKDFSTNQKRWCIETNVRRNNGTTSNIEFSQQFTLSTTNSAFTLCLLLLLLLYRGKGVQRVQTSAAECTFASKKKGKYIVLAENERNNIACLLYSASWHIVVAHTIMQANMLHTEIFPSEFL